MTAQEFIDLIRAETAQGGNTRARVADALEAVLAITGEPGEDGVGIANVVDNEDGTMTVVLTDDSEYVIELPAGPPGPALVTSAIQVVLLSTGWASNEQTVAAADVTASNHIIVTAATDDTTYNNYTFAGVRPISQSVNAVTFKCSVVPTQELTVNILIL